MAQNVLAEAKKALEQGNYADAKTKGKDAHTQLKTAFDSDEPRADAARTVISACLACGDFEEAKALATEELSYFRTVGHEKGEAGLLAKSLEIAVSQGAADEAIQLSERAQTVAKKLNDPEILAEVQQQVAKAYLLKGDSKEALAVANDLLASAKAAQDKSGQAAAWSAIADASLQNDTTMDDGAHAAKKALAVYKEMGNKKGEASALVALALAHVALGQPNEALAKAKEAKTLAKSLGDAHIVAEALKPLVQAQHLIGNSNGGRNAAMLELDECRSVGGAGDKRREAIILESVAAAYGFEKNGREAVTQGMRSVELWKELGDRAREADVRQQVSELLRAQGKNNEALKMADSARAISRELGSTQAENTAATTMSGVYVAMGKPTKAPNRKLAIQAIDDLVAAAEARDAEMFDQAQAKLATFAGCYSEVDIMSALESALDEDKYGIQKFLKQQGFMLSSMVTKAGHDAEPSGYTGYSKTIYQYDHQTMYGMGHFAGGVVFGPQFRSVHPYRAGKNTALCAAQLPECEDWQYKLGLKPGILDSGFQQMQANDFPPYYDN